MAYRTRTAFVSAARTAAQCLLLCNKTDNDVLYIASVLSLFGKKGRPILCMLRTDRQHVLQHQQAIKSVSEYDTSVCPEPVLANSAWFFGFISKNRDNLMI